MPLKNHTSFSLEVPGLGRRFLQASGLDVILNSLKQPNSQVGREAIRTDLKDISIAADKQLHEKISAFLLSHSDYPILSEEADDQLDFAKAKGPYWIIDPLDGSLNFHRSIPLNCISIALWEGRKPRLGIVYDFHRDEMFEADTKKGAFLNGVPIHVSTTKKPSDGIVSTGFPSWRSYEAKALKQFVSKVQNWKKVRMIGSAALTLAWISSGRFDAYVEEDVRIWDVAAGLALVQAAGGSILCKPNARKNFVTTIATNGSIPLKLLA
jgi:myo-inositol-1(or 4)-monophosphatase